MVSHWMWIAGGVIAGLIIFSVALSQITQVQSSVLEQKSIEKFDEVVNIMKNLCWSFTGNKRMYTIELGESIDGIYAAETPYKEYEKNVLEGKIKDSLDLGITSFGNYLCLKVKNKRLRCQELECNVSIPFLGSIPEKFSLSALVSKLMGRGKIFSYSLSFERGNEFIVVNMTNFEKKEVPLI